MKKTCYGCLILLAICFLPSLSFSQNINRDSLLQVLPTLDDDSNKVNCLTSICFSYVGRSEDSILFYVTKLEEVAVKINHPKGLMNVQNMNGMVSLSRGNLKSALERYTKMLEIAEQNGFERGINIARINISAILVKLNEFEKALNNYYKLIPALEKNNDKKNMQFVYMNMAIAYSQTKKFDSSMVYNKKALPIAEESKQYQSVIDILDNMGNNFSLQGKLDSAKYYYKKALAVIEREKMYPQKARVLLNLSRVNEVVNKDTTALEFHKVFSLLDSTKTDATLVFDALVSITNYFEKAKKYDSAFYYLRKQNELAKKIYTDTLSKNSNEMYIKYQTEIKKQQIELLEKENNVKELTLKKETQRKYFAMLGLAGVMLAGIYVFYLYRRKNALSNQLSQSLTELKQTQTQLIQLEKEKEAEAIRLRISRDIHDDIGSNLTKIAMMGNLAAAQSKSKMPEMTEQLEKISDYARNVNSSMSEIIWAVNPKQDTLGNLLAYMRVHTEEFLKDSGINHKINFPEVIPAIQLNPDLKRSLFLVLKESLNNAVKHADAKNILVSFKTFEILKNPKVSFELQITDDGKGFDAADTKVTRSGNGLSNLEARMLHAGGTFSIQSTPGKGCNVVVKGEV